MPEAFDDVLKVAPLLETFRGRTAFFDELSGNNGDDLISDGGREAIKRAGIRCLDDPAAADLQIVTGGAGLSSVWGGAYERMRPYALPSAAERPLVVLPSTISIETFDLPALFRQRTAKTWVFARER